MGLEKYWNSLTMIQDEFKKTTRHIIKEHQIVENVNECVSWGHSAKLDEKTGPQKSINRLV